MMKYFEFRRGELKDNSHSYLIEVQRNMNLKDSSDFGESQNVQTMSGLLEVSSSFNFTNRSIPLPLFTYRAYVFALTSFPEV